MTITITRTASTGAILAAETERFGYFEPAAGITDKAAGRQIHLGLGYARLEGWGCDPCPPDVMDAARAFWHEVTEASERLEAEAEAARRAAVDAATAVLTAIPAAARAELAQINADLRRKALAMNEGGEGYVHQVGWDGNTGREILVRHGLADRIGDIDAAIRTLSS